MAEGSAGVGQAGGEGASTATATSDANAATSEGQNVDNNSETTENKSDYRTSFRDRINKHFPDSDDSDNETFYKNANERYSKLSDYQKKNQTVNKAMIDSFNSNPELAGLMRDIVKGAPLNVAIARNLDIDSIKPQEGDADESQWAEGLADRKKKLSDREAYQNSITENINMSMTEVKSFAEDNNLDGETTAAFLTQVDQLIADAITGKISKKTLSSLYRASTADSEVTNAAKAAEVKGRNANIEAVKAVDKPEGDGLPQLQSSTEDKGDKDKGDMDSWSQAVAHQVNKRRI